VFLHEMRVKAVGFSINKNTSRHLANWHNGEIIIFIQQAVD